MGIEWTYWANKHAANDPEPVVMVALALQGHDPGTLDVHYEVSVLVILSIHDLHLIVLDAHELITGSWTKAHHVASHKLRLDKERKKIRQNKYKKNKFL